MTSALTTNPVKCGVIGDSGEVRFFKAGNFDTAIRTVQRGKVAKSLYVPVFDSQLAFFLSLKKPGIVNRGRYKTHTDVYLPFPRDRLYYLCNESTNPLQNPC